jgi:recombination endonuclease VII
MTPNIPKQYIMEGNKRRSASPVICEKCKKSFLKRTTYLKDGKIYFCSPLCHNTWQKEKLLTSTGRICTTCKIDKPLDQYFTRHDREVTRSKCKSCSNKKRNIYLNKAKKANPAKYKDASNISGLKIRYGLDKETYELLLKKQNNLCVICKKPETRILRGNLTNLSVDHCHETGKIRALLCSKCNTLIGLGNEDVNILQSAIKYLKKWKIGCYEK